MTLWRDANRLMLVIEEAVRKFPRYHKYAIGTDLRRQAQGGVPLHRFVILVQWGREFTLRGVSALGMDCGSALPLSALKTFRRRLRKAGLPHVFVAEEGLRGGGLKHRVLRLAWAPNL